MIEKIKKLLGLEGNDRDDEIRLIIEIISKRLKMRIGQNSIPSQLEYIVIEASIIRFNRIASEGAKIHTVEGETVQYNNSDDDLKAFEADIAAYVASQKETKSMVKFL